MQRAKTITKLLVWLTFLAWVGWDLYVALVWGSDPTESDYIAAFAVRFPWVVFAAGYLMGHFFGFRLTGKPS